MEVCESARTAGLRGVERGHFEIIHVNHYINVSSDVGEIVSDVREMISDGGEMGSDACKWASDDCERAGDGREEPGDGCKTLSRLARSFDTSAS